MRAMPDPVTRDWRFPRHRRGLGVLVDHGLACGVSVSEVLAGTGLGPADLVVDGEATADQELRAVRNLLRSPNPAARSGTALGRRYRLETFGIAGYALATSPTLWEAVEFALRYLDLTFLFSFPDVTVDDEQVIIQTTQVTLPEDVREFLVHRDLSAIEAALRELRMGALETRLDLERRRLTFPAVALSEPLPRANPAVRQIALQRSRDLAAGRRDPHPLIAETRILLTQRLAYDPSAAGVAHGLAIAERTLRRRLAAHGTSFQRLLDEVRMDLADQLLETGGLTVAQVAQRLGYAESASFITAHRRWHGTSPLARHRSLVRTSDGSVR